MLLTEDLLLQIYLWLMALDLSSVRATEVPAAAHVYK